MLQSKTKYCSDLICSSQGAADSIYIQKKNILKLVKHCEHFYQNLTPSFENNVDSDWLACDESKKEAKNQKSVQSIPHLTRERRGSVVECLNLIRVTALCP